jgi:hypothetical protein
MKDVLLDGSVVIENDPAFGSPMIRGGTPNGFMSFTSDGVGAVWGGTGITVQQRADAPDQSEVAFAVNDEIVIGVRDNCMAPKLDGAGAPVVDLGNAANPWRRICAQIRWARVGAALASSATIAPDSSIHHVTGTTSVQTITPPFDGFTGDVTLIMDENCQLATGGNIDPYTVETANLASVSAGAVGGKAKVVLTYDGSSWY